MPYSSSGGPPINTGSATWDQGLGSIFSAFDPGKIAQAGYYGAEQRYKQLQSNQLQEQLAAGHQWLGMTTGQMPGRPQYVTDPATGQNRLADTAAVWAPPASSGSPPPAAPPGPAPISSAVVEPPPGPAPGSASGSAPGPAPAPSFQGGGEGGAAGPLMQAVMQASPASVANAVANPAPISDAIASSVQNASTSNSGPPLPPASPPAPSAPPAPNTTTTDGKTPADNGAGPLHPGSFTPPGGGVKMSGAAASDGSPAPVAVNLGQLVALGVMKGMPAADAMTVARGVVANWVKTGQMDQQHADDMLADLGETAMRVANLNNAGALQRTQVSEGAATQRQGMVTGETAREFNEQIIQVVNPADPNGPPIPVARKDLKPGMQEWNQGIATQRGAPVLTNGPNGAVNRPLSDTMVPGANQPTVYTPGTADIKQTQGGAYGTFVDPNDADPTHARTMTTADAAAKGWVPYGTLAPKTPMTANESFQQNAQAHGIDQEIYQQSQKGSLTSPGYVSAPVVFSPAAQTKIQTLTAQFMRNPASRGDPGVAHRMAVQALQQNGDLPSATQVETLRNAGGIISTAGGRVTDPRLSVSPTYDGKGTTTSHLWVGLKGESNPNDPGAPTAFNPEPGPRAGSKTTPQQQQQPQQSAPVAQAPPPPTAGVPLSAQSILNRRQQAGMPVPPPAPPAVMTPSRQRWASGDPSQIPVPTAGQSLGAAVTAPPGAIGRAAPGAADGSIQYDTAGRPAGIVRGGLAYPMPAMTAGGGG